MKRQSRYASMKTSDLARITRERGLDKPSVSTRSEWVDFLEADDMKRRQVSQTADVIEDHAPQDAQDVSDDISAKSSKRAKSHKAKES